MPSLLKTCLLAAASLTSIVSAGDSAPCTSTSTFTSYSTFVSLATSTAPPRTSTIYATTITETIPTTQSFTSYTTKANTTSTVPAAKGFTPFASIKPTIASSNIPTPYNKRQPQARNPRNGVLAAPRRAAATATGTICYSTVAYPTGTISYVSDPVSYLTATQATTITSYQPVSTTTHITVSTATATVYAACQNSANTGTTWQGQQVNQWVNPAARALTSLGTSNTSDSTSQPQNALWRAGNQSPEDCCNAAFAIAATQPDAVSGATVSGFVFSGSADSALAQGTCRLLTAAPTGDLQGTYFWTGEEAANGVPYHLGVVAPEPDFTYEGACEHNFERPCPFLG